MNFERKLKMSIYNIQIKNIQGEQQLMSDYKGKYLLIVNTASKCGLTPQYRELQRLYEEFAEKGLVILGFPCNQFAGQEPGTEEEIQTFCEMNYRVSFPMFSKIEVKGENAHPLYRYLVDHCPALYNNEIEWNFVKFLVSPDGKVLKKYAASTDPKNIRADLDGMILN